MVDGTDGYLPVFAMFFNTLLRLPNLYSLGGGGSPQGAWFL
jgi:hypothetical protein